MRCSNNNHHTPAHFITALDRSDYIIQISAVFLLSPYLYHTHT